MAEARGIGAGQHARVGEGNQRNRRATDQHRAEVGDLDPGDAEAGKPSGKGPSTATPFADKSKMLTTTVAPTTAISTPGSSLLPFSSRMTASTPTPIPREVQLILPTQIDVPISSRARNGPSASTEKPSSLGNWLISTTRAMPFM